MQIYFKTRQLSRNFKANAINPDNKQLKDNGADSPKRWGVVIQVKKVTK